MSSHKYQTGGKLPQNMVDNFNKRMYDIEYMDDDRLIEIYEKTILSENNTFEENGYMYSKENVEQEILDRMLN